MVDKIKYDVVSPEAKVTSGEAESILIPGIEGDFTVLSKHASYLSTLRPGILKIFSSGDEKEYFVNSGFAEVSTEGLVILAERAVEKSNINILMKNSEIIDITSASDQFNIKALNKTIKKYFICFPND